MGEVYRAKDTKLGREVAIKLLLEEVSQDAERLARFEREAKVLASPNHNNIATLYGFESEGDKQFLVMEVVEGETLADRIRRGAIPVEVALPLFIQIAEGLEAAHEKGVIHRYRPASNPVCERFAVDQLHDEEAGVAFLLEAVEGRDVVVIQGGEDTGLTLEPGHTFRISGDLLQEELDRDLATELGVLRPIDLSHAALSNQLDDLVRSQASAGF